jgi:Flp pilus assembly protein TadD
MNSCGFDRELHEARQELLAHNFARALPRYERLTRRYPGVSVLWFEYGNAASSLREFGRANQAWRRAIELAPENAELVSLIGHQYLALRQPEHARECFVRAASSDPRALNPRISLAVLLEKNHRLEEARTLINECLAFAPGDDQARYFSAVLDRREGRLDEAERRLRDLIVSNPTHPYVRYSCRYELAQILDQRGCFDEAMGLLAEAKQMVRTLTDTDLLMRGYDRDAANFRRLVAALPRDILKTWDGIFPKSKRSSTPSLAFLGGHPRSGTTLIEQVLDAHPAVAAFDEPTAFHDILQPAAYRAEELTRPRLNALRERYLKALEQELGSPAGNRILVDKNPSPTARLPIWLRVFPELRVLVALRDPRDVILSCYFQNIPLNATNVNFLDFDRLARHYADLMDVWLAVREWSGFAWLETRYEDTVANLEREGRRVTEFLGLTWDERQARYYEKSRTKQLYSPTYQDVTRPIYARSVGRWQAYERHLAPVLPSLESYCRAFGYS